MNTIHNFLSDVLQSISILFDRYIFNPNYIKSYEFNIANRTFQLSKNDYKPNYSLPAAIVKLNDEQYTFGERPSTIQHSTIANMNQVPVLLDLKSGNKLILQEEHSQLSITVTINCESQLQAKDVEFKIKHWLPLNKYIQVFNFTSFIEVSPHILETLEMDFNDREIINLFIRLNKNLGQVEHFFSNNYYPLIKLESIDSSLDDGTNRTFSVNCELTYQIQTPKYFINEFGVNNIEHINLDFANIGNNPIINNTCKVLFNKDFNNIPNYKTLKNIILSSLDDWWCESTDDTNLTLIQKYIDDGNISIFNLEESILKLNRDASAFLTNKLLKTNNIIKYLIFEEDVISIKSIFHFLCDIYDNSILKCINNKDVCKLLFYQILYSTNSKLLDLIWIGDITFRDIYDMLIYNNSSNQTLNNLNLDLTFFKSLYNNEINIHDIFHYILNNKLENIRLKSLLDNNVITRLQLEEMIRDIGFIRNIYNKKYTIFSITLTDFEFSKDYIYSIRSTTGQLFRDIEPFFIDNNTHTIYFSFLTEHITQFFMATLTTPVIIQIGERG